MDLASCWPRTAYGVGGRVVVVVVQPLLQPQILPYLALACGLLGADDSSVVHLWSAFSHFSLFLSFFFFLHLPGARALSLFHSAPSNLAR